MSDLRLGPIVAPPWAEKAAARRRGPSPFANPYRKSKPAPRAASPASPFDFAAAMDAIDRDPSGGTAELGGRIPAPS